MSEPLQILIVNVALPLAAVVVLAVAALGALVVVEWVIRGVLRAVIGAARLMWRLRRKVGA